MSQPLDESAGPPGTYKPSDTSQQPADAAENPTARLGTLGERLRTARYTAHMTQDDLAGETFSKSYISAVERSKMTPSISALRLLAERLGVSLAYLLGEQEQNPPSPEYAAKQQYQPGEDEFVQRLEEAEQLLRGDHAAAALERLGSQEAAAAFGLPYQARWNWLYGWALLQQHREQEVHATLEQGLEAAQASQDRRSEGYLYLTRAAAAAQREDTAAEQGFQQAAGIGEQLGDYELLGCVHEGYGAFLAQQHRYKEAYEQMLLVQTASTRRDRNR